MNRIIKFLILVGTLIPLGLAACGPMTSPEDNLNGGGNGDDLGAPAPKAPGFNLARALELGRLCLQSYQMLDDFNDGKTFTLPAPYTLIKQFFTTEIFDGEDFGGDMVPIAYIATDGQTIYVVFRGTDTIIEWIDDAELAQVPYTLAQPHALTEEGFTKIYLTIHQDILATLQDLMNSGTYDTLFITGHSLGSSLASLALPELAAQTFLPTPTLYNFASPRTGDPKFANETYDALGLTTVRVANTNDLVPKLPQPVVAFFKDGKLHTYFYEHVMHEHAITFGNPISGPTDIKDVEFNHAMCHYYNTLCGMTTDPSTCMAMADGADGCNL